MIDRKRKEQESAEAISGLKNIYELKNRVVSKSKGTMHVQKIFDSEIIF